MNQRPRIEDTFYGLEVEPLVGRVRALRGRTVLADTTAARVMYETRLEPTIYVPLSDVRVKTSLTSTLQTFCPFKGTAQFGDLEADGETLPNAVWAYADALPEARGIEGYVGFMPGIATKWDLGGNTLHKPSGGNLSGPVIDWLLREAPWITTPEELTEGFATILNENGFSITRLSLMIWSLHPLIVGHNYVWKRETGEVDTFAPTYELHDHPSFINSPLRHVSNGLGGVRQKLDTAYAENSFPIMEDLRKEGATDYVAMPMIFSDGRTNVLTLTTDHADGFSTSELGMVFECSFILGRLFEVFTLKENAQSVLETYVGKSTGARVLGGEIRRGDGDEIDAAIMFCDLRRSTRLEEVMGRKAYIEMLNDFFESVSNRVQNHGGEVLKFIGDAVLAVFPAGDDPEAAKSRAVEAARDIVCHLDALPPRADGERCDCSIGLAFGQVTYGNVGSRERLDFTVIGQAANVAARLGDHGKKHGHRIVVAADLADGAADAEPLGDAVLHNVSRPVPCAAILVGETGKS